MTYTILIPARLNATRLPEKLIKRVAGKTILQYVYENCKKAQAMRIVVTTDSEKIQTIAKEFGAETILTANTLTSGTERVAESARLLQLDPNHIVVNVQGDEPNLPPSVIRNVALRQVECSGTEEISTAASPLCSEEKKQSPQVVKVVCRQSGQALYFSRYAIPFAREPSAKANFWQHLGIYAYRVSYVTKFLEYPPSALEQVEMLEQLRALWYGDRIGVYFHNQELEGGIDTVEDLENFSSKIEKTK